ncbi:glycogen/starch/alpha-glucan phosphorylase [bacterium]|nr:glycogen/starch/alpha-glucan phosphorylase [bacterium]
MRYQHIRNGYQVETPDNWLPYGNGWETTMQTIPRFPVFLFTLIILAILPSQLSLKRISLVLCL